jgi:5,6,7,8-tetrahydromethanopterin hydro-lyase
MQEHSGPSRVSIGEGFVGEGAEAAHVNTVLGARDGPVGTAWATALAMPRPGHVAFVTVLQPGLPVKPLTLFVNKAPIADDAHADLTWGAAQAGVAGGVADAVADGVIAAEAAEDLLLIAAVWINPAAREAALVYRNTRAATRAALQAAQAGTPTVADMLAARHAPANQFFTLTTFTTPATPTTPATSTTSATSAPLATPATSATPATPDAPA